MKKGYIILAIMAMMLSSVVSAADWQMDKREAEQLKFQEKYQQMKQVRINQQAIWELQMKIKQMEYNQKVYQMQIDKIKTLQRKQSGTFYFEQKMYGRIAHSKYNKYGKG